MRLSAGNLATSDDARATALLRPWDNRTLYFADGASVYSGFPVGGLPKRCTTPPAEPDNEFDQRDGCLPYSFYPKSGAVTIGDKVGTYKDGRLTVDGHTYSVTRIPKPGTRLSIDRHLQISFSGICGLFLGCTVTRQHLTLTANGQSVLSSNTTATSRDPGGGLAGGRIRLAFADGTVRTETFAIQTDDKTLAPDPAGEGVLLGAVDFYPDEP